MVSGGNIKRKRVDEKDCMWSAKHIYMISISDEGEEDEGDGEGGGGEAKENSEEEEEKKRIRNIFQSCFCT